MNPIARNVISFTIVAVVWLFFFVPNPLLHMFNVQGLAERVNSLVLFGVLPLALAAISMFTTTGRVSTRIVVSLLVPVLGVATCLLLWVTGTYTSSEDFTGAWLYSLLPVVAYIVGIVVATVPRWRRHKTAS
jgi:hypothetical protein